MRLPWVSRTMYDAIVAAKDVNIAELTRESADLRVRIADGALHEERRVNAMFALRDDVEALRIQRAEAHAQIQRLTDQLADAAGREATQKGVIQYLDEELSRATARAEAAEAAATKPKRSKLTQAIRDNARMPDGSIDRRLVSYFRGQANELLRNNAKESDVIEQISQWQTTEHHDALSPDLMAALAEEP